jgi:23S rRNA (cytosine1962-C5)-methyltransferase
MFLCDSWRDYEVLDTGDGEKLERWKDVVLCRPDPQVIWPKAKPELWETADARYIRSSSGGGEWQFFKTLPERWTVAFRDLKFYVRPTGFKHTGLFPEQAVNWLFMQERIKKAKKRPMILNLFAYTGGATVACAAVGAHVTPVDAARGMTQWAKENRDLSGIPEDRTRFIVEDVKAFVSRELRRGNRYDGILMDPPSYGRGPGGEVWKLEDELYGLAELCARLLSDTPAFYLINGYTTGFAASVLGNVLERCMGGRGAAEAGEIALRVSSGGVLPCGATARWTPDA